MTSGRARHPSPEIERAVRYAESLGWRVRMTRKGHSWGTLYCPRSTREGCIVAVWSTPRSAQNHARQIVAAIQRCPHQEAQDD